jgi:sugar lactone lactonase YvrE
LLALAATIAVGGSNAAVADASTAPSGTAAASTSGLFPHIISLPDGWQPEGIATGRGTSLYSGSLVDGAIWRADLATGRGAVLVPGTTGGAATGLKVDARNRLFVSGAGTGTAHVYNARTGATLASYTFAPAGSTFINDVVVTQNGAYFTDSVNPVVYVLPFGRNGRLPSQSQVRTLPLSGDLVYQTGFNANGIQATPDGRRLIIVQSNTGGLFSVSPTTGVATTIDLGGATLVNGDGLLLRGHTLYAVQNQQNEITVVRMNRRFDAGTVTGEITDPAFDVPTTLAAFGPFLYAVNARFGTTPTPTTPYTVVRVRAS